jgi:hypothetical protein
MSFEGAGEFLDLELGEVAPGVGIESGEIMSWPCLDDRAESLDGEPVGTEETTLELAEIGVEKPSDLATSIRVECLVPDCTRAAQLIEQGGRVAVVSASGDCLADELRTAKLEQNNIL